MSKQRRRQPVNLPKGDIAEGQTGYGELLV